MDPTDLGPGIATWLGGSATVVLRGLLWLRRFLSKDATDRAMDSADIRTLKRLNELLNQERAARKEAEARAYQFAKTRGVLQTIIGAILIVVGVIFPATPFGTSLIGAGIGLVAGGVIQMLSPQAGGLKTSDTAENTPGYAFGRAKNTTASGNPVSLRTAKVSLMNYSFSSREHRRCSRPHLRSRAAPPSSTAP